MATLLYTLNNNYGLFQMMYLIKYVLVVIPLRTNFLVYQSMISLNDLTSFVLSWHTKNWTVAFRVLCLRILAYYFYMIQF